MVIADRTIRAAIVKPTTRAAIVNFVCVMPGLPSPRGWTDLPLKVFAALPRIVVGQAHSEEVDGGQLVAVFRMHGRIRLWRDVDDGRARVGDPLPAAGGSRVRRRLRGRARADRGNRPPPPERGCG